jgi:hypothetical protein
MRSSVKVPEYAELQGGICPIAVPFRALIFDNKHAKSKSLQYFQLLS